jgi:hypothetical protein
MSKQIVYATGRVPNLDGRMFQNPRHFTGPVEGATKVYIDGDWPVVRKAYEAAGVSVSPQSDMRAAPKPKQPSGAAQTGAEPNS